MVLSFQDFLLNIPGGGRNSAPCAPLAASWWTNIEKLGTWHTTQFNSFSLHLYDRMLDLNANAPAFEIGLPALPKCHSQPHHLRDLTRPRGATGGACSPLKHFLHLSLFQIFEKSLLCSINYEALNYIFSLLSITSRISLGVETVMSPLSDTLLQQNAVIPS